MLLDADRFRTVVAATPLVSIDLIVRRADGAILLGERLNRPAQGYWFVPGGRIRKNESLDLAFARLSEGELGRVFSRDRARLLGVYEHFYRDSVFGEQPDTHYVVLGYLIELGGGEDLEPPHEQHGRYRWSTPQQMRADEQVHPHSLAYLEALA
ncbi:GDP-mannose mannosyl hydrolase [Stutzerimonas azotifigens]|uniref:GDP-mannose mannosyl hydrolase n=1 Tax=Stutzerimonas azotifigens TaxID=291995 RepID=UPI0004029CF5|nr:GDP-mannose mannosyl hydrolase [Stutzerimonas azotifigens]